MFDVKLSQNKVNEYTYANAYCKPQVHEVQFAAVTVSRATANRRIINRDNVDASSPLLFESPNLGYHFRHCGPVHLFQITFFRPFMQARQCPAPYVSIEFPCTYTYTTASTGGRMFPIEDMGGAGLRKRSRGPRTIDRVATQYRELSRSSCVQEHHWFLLILSCLCCEKHFYLSVLFSLSFGISSRRFGGFTAYFEVSILAKERAQHESAYDFSFRYGVCDQLNYIIESSF